MTTNLHEMFGLPDKKVDYKARLIAATEHMRSEVKDVFRELDLDDDDPRQRRLMDACYAWVRAATEMADAHTDHVEQRVAQISDKVVIKMRKEVEVAAIEKLRDMDRLYRPLVFVVALVAGITGFVAGQYYNTYTEASEARSSWLASPQPQRPSHNRTEAEQDASLKDDLQHDHNIHVLRLRVAAVDRRVGDRG